MKKLAHLFTPFSSLIINETYFRYHPQLHLACQLRPYISACIAFVSLSRPRGASSEGLDLQFRTAH